MILAELEEILKDMKKLRKNPDTEHAHGVADSLLCDALWILAKGSKVKSKVVKSILDRYDEIDKSI